MGLAGDCENKLLLALRGEGGVRGLQGRSLRVCDLAGAAGQSEAALAGLAQSERAPPDQSAISIV